MHGKRREIACASHFGTSHTDALTFLVQGLTWKPGSCKAKLKTGALDSGVQLNSLFECYVKQSPHLTALVDYPSAMKNI